MGLVHDPEVWQTRLAALPVARYEADQTVFAEGTKTGKLLILTQVVLSLQLPFAMVPLVRLLANAYPDKKLARHAEVRLAWCGAALYNVVL